MNHIAVISSATILALIIQSKANLKKLKDRHTRREAIGKLLNYFAHMLPFCYYIDLVIASYKVTSVAKMPLFMLTSIAAGGSIAFISFIVDVSLSLIRAEERERLKK